MTDPIEHRESATIFAIVTGGGTAGHVLPALAIADALRAQGHDPTALYYVGTKHGIEQRLVPSTPYAHTLLDVVGLQRRFSRRNLSFLPRLIRSIVAASKLVKQLDPSVIVNVGGYASFPVSFVAKRHHVPLIVVSYDQRPGLVTRVLARRAAACAVAFEGSKLPRAVITGAPIRHELATLDRPAQRARARQDLGLPDDRFVVAVMCGSLGSQPINQVVEALVDRWSDRTDVAVFHIVGDRFVSQAAPQRDGLHGIMYCVKGYESNMTNLYAAADIVVARAGAGTVAEIEAVGVPAIVVPWPGAAANHQVDNARSLSDHGAAMMVEQPSFTVDWLARQLDELIAQPDQLLLLGHQAFELGTRHRDGSLVALIERSARQ